MSRVYFTDRALGRQFPRILVDSGLNVERHGDIFKPDGRDEEWLEHCGEHGHIALSHNIRIRHVPNELAAIRRFRVALLILVGKVPTADLALNFVRTLPRIEEFLTCHSPPFIANTKVYLATPSELARSSASTGRVELWYPKP